MRGPSQFDSDEGDREAPDAVLSDSDWDMSDDEEEQPTMASLLNDVTTAQFYAVSRL